MGLIDGRSIRRGDIFVSLFSTGRFEDLSAGVMAWDVLGAMEVHDAAIRCDGDFSSPGFNILLFLCGRRKLEPFPWLTRRFLTALSA
jgi:hypothetical protein